MVTPLSVWMDDRLVARLVRRHDEMSLRYTEPALELGTGRPLLSTSMPVRRAAYRGAVPHAFFEGLLPEGEARRTIAWDLGIDPADAFGLLGALGRDCAGSLVVVPKGDEPQPAGLPVPVSDEEIGTRLRALRVHPLGVDERVRASLAGVQDKLLLSRTGAGWALPADGAPSTHIAKPPIPSLTGSVANEGFCARVADGLGLEVASAEAASFGGVQALLVARFDRTTGPEGVTRLHQEDACQSVGLPPRSKYEAHGGPSLRQFAGILRQWAHDEDVCRLLDLTVLNVALGNADAHGKNLSILHGPSGRLRLAPTYDLMCTTIYPGTSTEPGMLVNGVDDIGAVTSNDLVDEAASWGLDPQAARQQVERLVGAIPAAVERAAAALAPPPGVLDLLAANTARLAGGAGRGAPG